VNAAAPISLADLARDARQGARVVWLDQAAYACRLFCPGEDIWSDARRYVAMARQAQALLGSDVLEWRLGDAQRAAVRANPALIPPLVGRRVGFALRKLIAEAPLIERTTAVLTALQSLFPAVPRVLVVESVESQLTWLAGLTTAEAETAVDASDVDDAAVHLAGAVRGFSAAGLSGLVLDLTGPGAFPTDQILELHRPLLNVARHYDWSLGVLVDPRQLPEDHKDDRQCRLLALRGGAARTGRPRGRRNDRRWPASRPSGMTRMPITPAQAFVSGRSKRTPHPSWSSPGCSCCDRTRRCLATELKGS